MTTTVFVEKTQQIQRWLSFLEQDVANTHLLNTILHNAVELDAKETLQTVFDHLKVHQIKDLALNRLACLFALQLGQLSDALEFGQIAFEQDPNDLTLVHNMAFAHLYLNEFDQAYALLHPLFERGVEIQPDTYVLYARVLHQLEQPEAAIDVLQQFLTVQPNHATALGLLALLQYETNSNLSDNLNARATLKKALAIDSEQFEALLALAEIQLAARQITAANDNFNRILVKHPESGRAWSGLAQLAFYEANLDLAENYAQKAVQFMPNHIGTWHVLGWCHILKGNAAQAQLALDQAYALNSNFPDTLGALAVVQAMQGNFSQAEQWIQRAFHHDPESMAAVFAQHVILSQQGDQAAAQQKMNLILSRRAPSSDQVGATLVKQWLDNHPQFKNNLSS